MRVIERSTKVCMRESIIEGDICDCQVTFNAPFSAIAAFTQTIATSLPTFKRVPEKSKHARICLTKLSDTLFYDTSRLQARSDNFSLNPFVFCSVMRVLQRLKSVKATVLPTSI